MKFLLLNTYSWNLPHYVLSISLSIYNGAVRIYNGVVHIYKGVVNIYNGVV